MGPRSYRSPLETKKAAPAPGWYLIPLGPVPCLPHTGSSTACIDCRTETQPNKAAGNYEQFIVTDEVWQAAGMPLGNVDPKSFVLKGGGGCLCVGCIERRLGRRLTNADFVWQEGLWENRDAGWLTPRLVERLATGMADPRPIPKVMMIALRRDRRMRKAKSGEIDGTDVCILQQAGTRTVLHVLRDRRPGQGGCRCLLQRLRKVPKDGARRHGDPPPDGAAGGR